MRPSHQVSTEAGQFQFHAQRAGGPAQWFTLADAIASKLETGKAPKILRVMRFASRARQTLTPIAIAGDARYLIDPNLQCPIRQLVEHRARLKADRDRARSRGDDQAAQRFDAAQRAAKVIANAIAYGVPIEMNVVEHRRPVEVRVHRPDGSSYLSKVTRTEEPGALPLNPTARGSIGVVRAGNASAGTTPRSCGISTDAQAVRVCQAELRK